MTLIIKDLHTSINTKKILNGLSLKIEKGEIHVIMGPNGSGKSTLSNTLMGNPVYHVDKGEIILDGKNITSLKPHERARSGLFLGFQHPEEIPGVTVSHFLRTAKNAQGQNIDVPTFQRLLKEKMEQLQIPSDFSRRYLNEGFSGGEKKKCEILQMAILEPTYCILDEIDSGTDIDALKVITDGINVMISPQRGFLIITHYNRILQYLKKIDYVHILVNGKIVISGKRELANEIDKKGYGEWRV
ncbi:MAG: Fe-S cluster assembly ATPase SufC [Candidatus Woesearchaeota archaeon]|jgi:Fe-S cluster assembly ATP-binding protein